MLRFPPESSYGIVILELPPRATSEALLKCLQELLSVLATRPLGRELWIIESGRVRIHQRETECQNRRNKVDHAHPARLKFLLHVPNMIPIETPQ